MDIAATQSGSRVGKTGGCACGGAGRDGDRWVVWGCRGGDKRAGRGVGVGGGGGRSYKLRLKSPVYRRRSVYSGAGHLPGQVSLGW